MKTTSTQYAKALYELTKGKNNQEIDGIVSEFAKFLAKSGNLKKAPQIIENFENIYNKNNGIVEAEVISREELKGDLRVEIENFIKKKYKTEEVLINNKIDESIKGGIIVKVGDEVMDGSLKNQLNKLNKLLKS